jgi:alkylation response protein AidB-like acyl-CoA dehydrogenase
MHPHPDAPHLHAARQLQPLVVGLRDRFDQDRSLPTELVDAIRDADLLALWAPGAIGGAELPPLPFLEVIEELARQDASVGWCTVIPAGYSRLLGAMRPDVARDIFGAGRNAIVGTLNPSGKAVAVPNGYRVTGRWTYGSFIGHSQWVLGNCATHDANGPRRNASGEPDMRLVLAPRAAVEVFDVWRVGGLRATGSNDYQMTDLFVPEEYTVPLVGFSPPPVDSGPLYAMPMPSTFVSCIAIVALGAARGALETLTELAASRTPTGSQSVLREKVLAQLDLARAEAQLRSGRAYLFDELGGMWNDAVAGRPITVRQRALVRLAAWQAAQSAIHAVDLAYALAGGASLFEGNRIERCFRDVHAAGQHIALAQSNLEPIGRVLFDLDPGMARF